MLQFRSLKVIIQCLVALVGIVLVSSCYSSVGNKAGKEMCKCVSKIDTQYEDKAERELIKCAKSIGAKYGKYIEEVYYEDVEFKDPKHQEDFDAITEKCIDEFWDKDFD